MQKKRRTFSPQVKADIALRAMSQEESIAALCRQYSVASEQVSHWKAELRENADRAFGAGDRTEAMEQRCAELERLVGRLTAMATMAENEILKKTANFPHTAQKNNGSGL